MMQYLNNQCVSEFSRNLLDWSRGGPKPGGWTRAGDMIILPKIKLTSYRFGSISPEEGLAKNRDEVNKWHIAFLNGSPDQYYSEYLNPRYDEAQAKDRATTFLELFSDIKRRGINKCVWVADMAGFNLGFRYFRFNGCHRLSCAHVLSIPKVPAMIFNIKAL